MSKSQPTTSSAALQTLISNYTTSTPPRVKLIDSFLLFLLLSGAVQFAYRILVTSFPYNAFLGGYVEAKLFSPIPTHSHPFPPIPILPAAG